MMNTMIKICGVRDPDMARQTIELGARYIGIICYAPSKRYVDPILGKRIADAVKRAGGIPVAVFVDQNAEQMLSLCEVMDVDTIQLAGSIARQMHQKLPENFQRIYVLHVDEKGAVQADIDHGLSKLKLTRDQIMYDSLQSGSGRMFSLKNFTNPYSMPFFLAGGLTPENVADAIIAVHPDVVDVSSGVESSPGIKDLHKIKAFIEAVRGVQ